MSQKQQQSYSQGHPRCISTETCLEQSSSFCLGHQEDKRHVSHSSLPWSDSMVDLGEFSVDRSFFARHLSCMATDQKSSMLTFASDSSSRFLYPCLFPLFDVQEKRMKVFVEPAVLDDLNLRSDQAFSSIIEKLCVFREDSCKSVDFIICLGGDGTLLYASSLFQVNTYKWIWQECLSEIVWGTNRRHLSWDIHVLHVCLLFLFSYRKMFLLSWPFIWVH